MDASNSISSSNKFQRENDSDNQTHLQENGDEPATETTTQIIDLNDHCLMQIFDYLDLQNLFNITMASASLRPAALKLYKIKFGRKIIHLTQCDYTYRPEKLHAIKICVLNTIVYVYGLKTCLLYLRYFGSSINNLRMNFTFLKYERYQHLFAHVNTYCVDSLSRIKFWGMLNISMACFVKPFTNVLFVSVEHCDLGEELPRFVEWFPNLRHLNLENVSLTDGFDRAHFQHLERLSIIGFGYDQKHFILQNAANLLNSNRQLRNLEMYSDFGPSMDTMLDMIEHHSQITRLRVWCSPYFTKFPNQVINSSEVERILNEHSSLIELNLRNYEFTATDAIALVDQLKSLEAFDFWIKDNEVFRQIESELDQNKWIFTEPCEWDTSYVRLNRKN